MGKKISVDKKIKENKETKLKEEKTKVKTKKEEQNVYVEGVEDAN